MRRIRLGGPETSHQRRTPMGSSETSRKAWQYLQHCNTWIPSLEHSLRAAIARNEATRRSALECPLFSVDATGSERRAERSEGGQ